LPTIRPALVAKIMPRLLIRKVHLPKYPYIIKPERIVLISGMPDPLAYGAVLTTRTTINVP